MPAKKSAPAKKAEKKPEAIRGEFVEQKDDKPTPAPERAVAVRQEQPQDISQWRPEFAEAEVNRAIAQVAQKRRFFDNVMKVGAHYAIIPGQRPTARIDQTTGEQMKGMVDGKLVPLFDPPKPALLKPGAELLNAAMGLHPVLTDEYPPVMEERNGEMFIQFRRQCSIYRQTGPGENDRMLVGQASGECNSWEPKYRYRGSAGRVCPSCGGAFIIKGRAEYAPTVDGKKGSAKKPGFEDGGFVCLRSKGGCGENYTDADPRMKQDVAREKNPDPMGLTNTILKMADKRALVAATLIATGCSDLFTQDIEEAVPAPAVAAAGRTPGAASMHDDQGAEETFEDPGDPSDAAPKANAAGAKQDAPKPAAAAPVPAPAPAASTDDSPDPDGWAELRLFHRYRVAHPEDPRGSLFIRFMNEHDLKTWAELKRVWEKPCPVHAEYQTTYKSEVRTIIMPMGSAPDRPLSVPA